MTKRRLFSLLCGVALMTTFGLSGCSFKPPAGIAPVTPFAADRYLGTWYEIARLDHSFERGMTHVTAQYQANTDGSIQVTNRGYLPDMKAWKDAIGRAVFTGSRDEGALKVSFFGPFYGGYFVAALDPNYAWSLVVGPNRDYFWILARTPTLDDALKSTLLAQAQALGIDTAQLIWVNQSQPLP